MNKSLELFGIIFLFAGFAFAQEPSIQWAKCFGGTDEDFARSIIQISDGSFIVIGSTNSHDGDVILNHGVTNLWAIKLDSLGNLIWQKTIGGSISEEGDVIKKTR